MGIYPQPNAWLCGPFALKHALLLLGVHVNEKELAELAGTTPDGTDEEELARAAERYGCALGTNRYMDAEGCRQALTAYVNQGIPTLLCIEQWDHWVTAAHEDDGTFVILDSRHAAVFRVLPWEYLRELLLFRMESTAAGERGIYDLHPLVPSGPRPLKPAVTVARARFLQEWNHRDVARDWLGLLDDALSIAEPAAGGGHAESLSPGTFFGRHESELLDEASDSNDALARSRARDVLRRLRFLSDVYGLQIPSGGEQAALAQVRRITARRMARRGT
jgi:hypothetical protein